VNREAREFFSQLFVLKARFEICVKRKWREDALRYAMEGDWSSLAEYIREGGLTTPQMRSLVADILDGKITRPAKKIHKAKTKKRNRAVVRFIFEARQRGDKHIPQQAEEKFGLTWRQLQKILAATENRTEIENESALQNEAVAKLRLLSSKLDIPESVIECAAGVYKYVLNDMALTPHTLT
jgi:hypothetical protein